MCWPQLLLLLPAAATALLPLALPAAVPPVPQPAQTVQRLSPKNIIVYGAAPDDIFGTCIDSGINVILFESEISKAKRQVTV